MLYSCCYSIAVVFFLSFPNTLCCRTSNFYLTLCDPIDCSLSGSSVHGILQASVLEWVAVPFSKGSSQPRDRTQVSCIAGRFFTIWTTKEAHLGTRIAFVAFWTTNIFFFFNSSYNFSATVPKCYLSTQSEVTPWLPGPFDHFLEALSALEECPPSPPALPHALGDHCSLFYRLGAGRIITFYIWLTGAQKLFSRKWYSHWLIWYQVKHSRDPAFFQR